MLKRINIKLFIHKFILYLRILFKFKRDILKQVDLYSNTNEFLIKNVSSRIDNKFKNKVFNIIVINKLKAIRTITKKMILRKLNYIQSLTVDDFTKYVYTIVEEIILNYEFKIETDFMRLTNEYVGNELYVLVYDTLFKKRHDENIKFIFNTSWIYSQSEISTMFKMMILIHIFDITMKIAIVDMEAIIKDIDLTKFEKLYK